MKHRRTTSRSPADAAVDTDTGDVQSYRGNTIVSLLILAHLFLVAVALGGNFEPSPLVQQLLSKFASYTRALNFDLNFTRYQLTHSNEEDVDHRIEVLPEGKDAANDDQWIVLPDGGFRGGEPYKRFQRLGFALAFYSGDEVTAGHIAQSIGTSFAKNGVIPKQVRSRRHALQPIDAFASSNPSDRNPNSPGYFRVPYAANCLVNDDHTVEVVKIEDASHMARPNPTNGP